MEKNSFNAANLAVLASYSSSSSLEWMQTAVLSAHSLDGPEGMEWQVRQGGMAVMACPELRVLQEVSQSERNSTITFCRPVSGHAACYVV